MKRDIYNRYIPDRSLPSTPCPYIPIIPLLPEPGAVEISQHIWCKGHARSAVQEAPRRTQHLVRVQVSPRKEAYQLLVGLVGLLGLPEA